MFLPEIRKLIFLCLKAGAEILDVYQSEEFQVEKKNDDSPLTIADRHSHETIIHGLADLQIEGRILPVLSEEGRNIPYSERQAWDWFWMVDPLDGTKEFIKRNGEFTVNIALIRDGKAYGGVVYVPVHKCLYFGWTGVGAFKLENPEECNIDECLMGALELTGPEFAGAFGNSGTPVKIVASRSHMSPETEGFIEKVRARFGNVTLLSSGSSIKLCMVAEGNADVYPRFAPTMEWDTAAAQAVCEQAGIRVIDMKTGQALEYNKQNLLNNWFLVSGSPEFDKLV